MHSHLKTTAAVGKMELKVQVMLAMEIMSQEYAADSYSF